MLTLEGNNGQRTQLLARDHVFELATRARIAAQARARETWLPSAPTHSLPGAARQAGRLSRIVKTQSAEGSGLLNFEGEFD